MCSLYSYIRGALFTISIYIYLLSYFFIKRRQQTLNLVVVDGVQRTHFFYNNKISVYVYACDHACVSDPRVIYYIHY